MPIVTAAGNISLSALGWRRETVVDGPHPNRGEATSKFLVVHRGGDPGDGDADEAVMIEWMSWFGSRGGAVTEMGNPFSAGTAIGPDGSRSSQTAGLSGYSILEAASLDDAATAVAGCPHLKTAGSVEVYEAVPM